jgi:cystathionine gamma-lyase
LKFLHNAVGAIQGPFDSFLALRGLKTLALRMERHCSNALKIARWLEARNDVLRVFYPGLESHPQHALAKTQMAAGGGIVTVVLKRDLAGTKRFLERCKLFTLAESLGGVESLIEHRASIEGEGTPCPADLLRLSVGLEDPDDLFYDLVRALDDAS